MKRAHAVAKLGAAMQVLLDLQQRWHMRLVVGGSMPLLGLRLVNDVDVLVHPDSWATLELVQPYEGVMGVSECGNPKFTISTDIGIDIEFFKDSYPEGFAYLDLQPEGYAEWAGLPIWTLDQCRRWKQAFGRPKDLADIRLIEAHLLGGGDRVLGVEVYV